MRRAPQGRGFSIVVQRGILSMRTRQIIVHGRLGRPCVPPPGSPALASLALASPWLSFLCMKSRRYGQLEEETGAPVQREVGIVVGHQQILHQPGLDNGATIQEPLEPEGKVRCRRVKSGVGTFRDGRFRR